MRVTVEIVSGPSAGRCLELRTGQIANVGRAHWAELSLPGDSSLAGMHFAIACGVDNCTVRALNREWPVFVNDTKVGQETLQNGDLIVAGSHTFQVRIEGATVARAAPLPAAAPPVSPAPPPEAEKPRPKTAAVAKSDAGVQPVDLLDVLRRAQPLYALLDAARDDRVLELVRESGDEHQCLYEGDKAVELAEVAPHLVRLPTHSLILEKLLHEGWGKSWGVYLTSHGSFQDVRKHFRHFLRVESEGQAFLFRFYDPRVLRVFLPVCNPEESHQFFGPVNCFLIEAREPALLLKYTATRKGPKEELVLLAVA
jgi:hypothetical protein